MLKQPIMTAEAVKEYLASALPQTNGIFAVEAVGRLARASAAFSMKRS
jgi:hypothetical protein